MFWGLPGVFIGIVLALGDPQRIVFMDKQLAKDVDKLHANWQCMMSANIMSRYIDYCIGFPFIRHRMTTDSVKFRLLMWASSLWWWCLLGTIILITIAKALGIE